MTGDPASSGASQAPGSGRFVEVADRVWVARHEWFDLNVTLIGADSGLLVVDTNASEHEAHAMLRAIDTLNLADKGKIVGVVNTHEHFDHTFGNAVFRDLNSELPIYAHEFADVGAAGERIKHAYRASSANDPRAAQVLAARIVEPDCTFSSVAVIDLGDRHVELIYPGRGHTSGDLVVHVPDANVMVLGDLVEESAPPAWGPDSYPLEWPGSLDLVLSMMNPATVGVPGHGALVGREFVAEQQAQIAAVAQQVSDLAAAGVSAEELLSQGSWPYPVEVLGDAVARAWAHLPRASKQLPLA